MMRDISKLRELAEEGINSLDYKKPGLSVLYEPIIYGLGSGGKRLRPLLVLMGCESMGSKAELAIDAACAVEMFHNFTLLHDDVMDDSDMRRGRASVRAKWDDNVAILSGDTMLTLATQLVSNVSDDKLREVLAVFNRMAIEVYEGQRYDMDFEERSDVTSQEYIEMITLKTGALLGGSVRIGSLIGGATASQASAFDEYGRALGIAFQIQDDYLDVYGDEKTFGKPIGGDIIQGKKTFLLLEGLNDSSEYALQLREAMNIESPSERISTVRMLYDKMGIASRCKEAILHWTGVAIDALNRVGLESSDYNVFAKFADKLIGRTK